MVGVENEEGVVIDLESEVGEEGDFDVSGGDFV